MKKLILLGSTGSIGTQVLEVIDLIKENWKVEVLTANKSVDKITKQALKYKPKYVVLADLKSAKTVKNNLKNEDIEVLASPDSIDEIVKLDGIDLVINALVGAAGLKPTLNTLKKGTKLGLANKESLVVGGQLVQKELKKNKDLKILPIDSEHNAIFRLLEGKKEEQIKSIILTASGGPFFNSSYQELKKVTVKDALDHPNWSMGKKITIDSATMMNKGLEVIEAHWLFNFDYDRIKVVVHPQSIIHSMVELIDNTIYAEMSLPDMKMPIQYVMEYPEISASKFERLRLSQIKKIEFYEPDFKKFPCLKLAFKAGKEGGSKPIVLNAANEVAVEKFLSKEIRFLEIPELINKTLDLHQKIIDFDLKQVKEIDNWARNIAKEVV